MDIAIIKLSRTVRFTDRIRPICLFHPELDEVENPPNGLIVAGWGRTEKERSSDLLQYTFLEPVPMRQCQAEYGIAGKEGKLGPITNLEILKSQLCAQGVGATDSCTGDSGGPLMAQVGNTWYLAGVVSFGTGWQHLVSRWSSFIWHPKVRLLPARNLHKIISLLLLDIEDTSNILTNQMH